jgi:hypothetical protein
MWTGLLAFLLFFIYISLKEVVQLIEAKNKLNEEVGIQFEDHRLATWHLNRK